MPGIARQGADYQWRFGVPISHIHSLDGTKHTSHRELFCFALLQLLMFRLAVAPPRLHRWQWLVLMGRTVPVVGVGAPGSANGWVKSPKKSRGGLILGSIRIT